MWRTQIRYYDVDHGFHASREHLGYDLSDVAVYAGLTLPKRDPVVLKREGYHYSHHVLLALHYSDGRSKLLSYVKLHKAKYDVSEGIGAGEVRTHVAVCPLKEFGAQWYAYLLQRILRVVVERGEDVSKYIIARARDTLAALKTGAPDATRDGYSQRLPIPELNATFVLLQIIDAVACAVYDVDNILYITFHAARYLAVAPTRSAFHESIQKLDRAADRIALKVLGVEKGEKR